MKGLIVHEVCRTVYDYLASRHTLSSLKAGFLKTNKTEKEVEHATLREHRVDNGPPAVR